MKKKSIVFALICIAVVVGLFGWLTLSRKKTSVEDSIELTEVQKLTEKNIESTYPATPREVVRLYNRIITCYYNEEYTEDELYKLGDQARALFDEELLENNPRDTFFKDLKSEIDEYKSLKKTISASSVCSSNEVVTKKVDGADCAYVTASYFILNGKDKEYTRTYETYVLRKDEEGRWKILAFYLTEGDTSDE